MNQILNRVSPVILRRVIGFGLSFWYCAIVWPIATLYPQTPPATAPREPAPWRVSHGDGAKSNTVVTPTTAANPAANVAASPPQTPVDDRNRTSEFSDTQRSAPPIANQTNPPASEATGRNYPETEITRVSKTFSALPNTAGQVWREYDIQPYTSQITNNSQPQQAVIDWILRQTGKEMWFHEPFGILSATRDKVIVYHTPEIHNEIRAILDRLVSNRGASQMLEVHLVTVGNPNWRENTYAALQPIDVQSPGVEGWMISKENAAVLMNQLTRRADFQDHGGGRIAHHDGQDLLMENRWHRQFVRSLRWTPGQGSGYQPQLTQINEGYSLTINSLTSLDGKAVEVFIKCDIDQVEKFNQVAIRAPNATAGFDRVNLQIPEVISYRIQERVRWPLDQVLLLSCGVMARPTEDNVKPFGGLLDQRAGRGDALLFIEFRGAQPGNGTPTANAALVPFNPR